MPRKIPNTNMTDSDDNLPQDFLRKAILLLFALGGETLAFYEIKQLADILKKYVGLFDELTEAKLRSELNSQDDITTSNGNYYTCSLKDGTLPGLAIEFFSVPDNVSALLHIARQLPFAGTEGNSNPVRLIRDLRNSLFAKDLKYHLQCIEIQIREFPGDHASGAAYRFLTECECAEWLDMLSPELFSICIRQMVAICLHDIIPMNFLLDIALPKFEMLHNTARFPLIDLLIMAGRFQEAGDYIGMLVNFNNEAVQTRQAWLDFVHGDNDAAIIKYNEALENIRRPNYGNDFYFKTITGIFFVFALIKADNSVSRAMAFSNVRIALTNHLYGNTYRIFYAFLDNLMRGTEFPQELLHTTSRSLDCLVASLVAYWIQGGQLDEEQKLALEEFEQKAEKAGLNWLAGEAKELLDRLKEDWVPDFSPVPSTSGVLPLVDCVEIRPSWTQDLCNVSNVLNEYQEGKPMRAAWMVSFSPECATDVQLQLFEQHLTKTDKWSRGHRFFFDRLKRELKNTGNWPSYFTAQDIQAATMALSTLPGGSESSDSPEPDMPENALVSLDTLSHNEILPVLQDYPRLFWAEAAEQIPIQIVKDEPYIQISSEQNGKITLAIYPKIPPKSYLAAVRFDDNTLHLFGFREIHSQLARQLGNGISIPVAAADRLPAICVKLAKVLRIKSDYDLSSIPVKETVVVPAKAIMRLERKADGLNVELLFQPFGEAEALQKLGEGKRAILESENGLLVKKLRDVDGEREIAEKILALCPSINYTNLVDASHWLIENREGVFQFLDQLREIMPFCQILWKQDKRFNLSRKIGFGDVRMRAQRNNNWLEVDGKVVVDENLTLSFQKLLDLAKQQKGNFIELSNDGQIIQISQELRNTLDNFNNMGQTDKRGLLQFSTLALPALQVMLNDFQEVELAEGWAEQAAKIDEAKNLEIPPPEGFSEGTVLRDYQLEGYRWLMRLDHWGAGACLADDMGLGKTIQAIAFILAKAQEGPALVVAPTSACSNWLSELARFAPSLQTVVFGQGNREEMLKAMKPGMVMISSYGLLQSQIACFSQAFWRVVVLDEAQFIKNYQAKRSQAALQLNAKFRIATTGTPIENNLGELWTLFQFITPGLFGKRQFFQDKFMNQLDHEQNPEVSARLNALIKPFMLRRVKEEVLTQLPPKTEIELRVELSPEERAFYEAVRLNQLKNFDERAEENVGKQSSQILAAIMKLRLAACNPLLIEPGTRVPSAKMEAFKELVANLVAGGHKTLVFSQFVMHLNLIRQCLSAMDITFSYLDGSTPKNERAKIIEDFQNGNADVFLISLQAGGTGINLTRADYVILLDPWWNPAVEKQATDRAHRIGQTRPVTIYRIIAKDTIEDKIIDLHKQKQDLAEQLLAGANTGGALTAQELLCLLQDM